MLDPRFTHVVAVARAGSFTAAAEAVGVTQSALTRSIADLERQIGYAIFVRTPRGVLLTEQGRDFAERVQKLLEDTKEILCRPQGDDPYSGVLRIGVCPASLEFRLIDPLARLLVRHPSIRLDISSATFERIVQQLRNGGIDVAVGFDAAFAEWPDLRRMQIPSIHDTVLFVRREHPILAGEITLKSLAQYEFVSPSDSRPYGSLIRALYENEDIDWRKRIHIVDFFPIVRKIVAATDAIGVVSSYFAHGSESFKAQFCTLDGVNLFPDAALLCCAIRARWEMRLAARAFISIVQGTRSTEALSTP
jgi:DNA-binding transcriptional LysR family regulator